MFELGARSDRISVIAVLASPSYTIHMCSNTNIVHACVQILMNAMKIVIAVLKIVQTSSETTLAFVALGIA